jgi:hypothetical protein
MKRTAFAALGKPTAISLALLLGFATFQGALHSAHHLENPEEAAQCQVLAVSQHLAGVGAETPGVCTELLAVVEAPAPAGTERSLRNLFRPDIGRAPPSVPG